MAAASGAYGVKAGFNQSGGGYYMVLSTLSKANFSTYTPGTGSGGATTAGTFATYNYADGATDTSSLVTGTGNLLKDMGKTVISSGRTFRKFQAVAAAKDGAFGVAGTGSAYVTGYLEVSREGTGEVPLNRIVRTF